uniref:LCCL-domain containing protein n=1 Tax=Beauveria bassiana TaxID=176275 RepID=A0A8G0BM72_BEABA|nr:LCCL-domain containing protein [Beauveria bassiana]
MAAVAVIGTLSKDASGNILLDFENKPSGGMPGAVEKRVLNWEAVELNHTLFGNIRGRSRVVKVDELEDEWLKGGWEEGTEEVLHFKTEHIDSKGVVTQQVLGFVKVEGVRYQARRVLVTTEGSDKNVEITIIYDYLGTGEVSQ